MAEQGRSAPKESATPTLFGRTVGCASVQSVGKAWVQSGGCLHLFSLHTFRKANGTITKIELGCNEIGDKGAVALAECLKATLVTCVLQVRASLFSWHVCAHSQETSCHFSRC